MTTNSQQRLQPLSLEQLVRANIRKLSPYVTGRDNPGTEKPVFLDANESPDDPSTPYNRYPDGTQAALKNKIGALKNVPAEMIFIGNGSDEIIDMCFRVFCRPGIDKAVTFGPTFSMYKVIAQLNDVHLSELPLDSAFQPDPVLLAPFEADKTAKLLLLCSPNNPTGNSFDKLEELVQSFRGIVLVDEAYIEFSERASFLEQLSAYPNVVICQTFSKARALAGARIGIAFASPEIIRLLNATRMPYNISTLNQSAALASLAEEDKISERKQSVWKERNRMIGELSANPLVRRVYPTDANFILVRVDDAADLCRELARYDLLIKDQSASVPGCVRISIGAAAENDRLITAINQIARQKAV